MDSDKVCRILVIEDEPLLSASIEDMVRELGCHLVGPAARLDHALTLALQSDIDVAILVINVDGSVIYPVADVLRFRGIPFFFSVGDDFRPLPQRFEGSPTLPKPFSAQALSDALGETLTNSP
ncbi:response regulator [Microvirga sp. P5_D2]